MNNRRKKMLTLSQRACLLYFSCFSLFIFVFQMLLAYVNVETVLLKLDKVMYQHHITRLQQ